MLLALRGAPDPTYTPTALGTLADYRIGIMADLEDGPSDALGWLHEAEVDFYDAEKLSETCVAEIVVPLTDDALSLLADSDGRPIIGTRWVHIFRQGVVCFRGFPDDYRIDLVGGVVVIELRDPTEYLNRATYGDAERTNYFPPGEFTSLVGMTTTGDCVGVLSSAWTVEGSTSLMLVGGAAGGYVGFTVTLPNSTDQQVWHGSTWARLETGRWADGAMTLIRVIDGGPATLADAFIQAKMDEDSPRTTGAEVKIVAQPMPIVGGHTTVQAVIRFRVAPNSIVHYSYARLVRNDAETAPTGTDYSRWVSTLFAAGFTQTGLTVSRSVSMSGRTLKQPKRAEHSNHPNMLGEIQSMNDDVQWRYDARRNRVVIASNLGRTRTDIALATGWAGVITEAGVSGKDVAGRVISLGDADDPIVRDEAGAEDTTAPPWDLVEQVPAGLPRTALTDRPASILRWRKVPRTTIDVVLPAPNGGIVSADWVARLSAGDRVPTYVGAGPWSLTSTQRIEGIRVFPVRGDVAEAQLAEWVPA